MANGHMNIMVLFDMAVDPPESQEFNEVFQTEDWKYEKHLVKTLQSMGHHVRPFGVYNNIQPLIENIQSSRPDLIFNLCEAFLDDRRLEPNVAALLELLQVPYTGTGPEGLTLCKDKGLSKKILSYHQIEVPRFKISRKKAPLKSLKNFTYPTFIKPLGAEASEGIAKTSFADNESDCIERVHFIHEKLGADAIIEEFIEGRELYIGVVGNDRLQILPTQELFFDAMPEDGPRFATFKAKWDPAYRQRWKIDSGAAKYVPKESEKKMIEMCKKIYKLFGMKGYGRIDLRLRPNGDVVFLEANPNPSLGYNEDFAYAAKRAGISYEDLLDKIINLSGA